MSQYQLMAIESDVHDAILAVGSAMHRLMPLDTMDEQRAAYFEVHPEVKEMYDALVSAWTLLDGAWSAELKRALAAEYEAAEDDDDEHGEDGWRVGA